MKHLISVCIVVLWAYAYPSMSRMLDDSSVVKAHQQWMMKYEITYINSSEMEKRLQIFKENLDYIEKFNSAGNKSYTLGLNPYSDLTTEEFKASYTGLKVPSHVYSSKIRSNQVLFNVTNNIPLTMDWRVKGAVTDVKKQGQCDGCWAFAAVAAVEGFWKIKMGNLLTLSEQQLIDCDRSSDGCTSGSIVGGFNNIIDNRGILQESQYPYREGDGTCKQFDMDKAEAYITCYINLKKNDEQNLQRAVAEQPVAVGISVGDDFFKYSGGVYSGACGTSLDHAVTIVGYGKTKSGLKYWLIKNSWGKNWGVNGYMRIKREGGGPEGHCSIATHAYIPCIY
ncbi:macrodontain-1-like [Vicia villosa]|uniref:macrodontain-1-like n=1 Tax=Vicia villosa TaxID=3911 RepID=UPI00273C7A03|nr:macrodontain-1-like [Vicia villosa]